MTIDDSWYVKPKGISEHVSCGGVIARRSGDSVLIALVREDGRSGFILPKGHLEPGEDMEQAARREIAEEAGLTDLVLVEHIGTQERLDYRKRSWKTTHYYLFTTEQIEGRPTDPDHRYELGWFPLSALPPMFWPEQRDLIEQTAERIVRAGTH